MSIGFFTYLLSTQVPGNPALPVYGHDLSCTTDIDPGAAEVDGITSLAQSLLRRLITPRGTLIDDQNYGFDLSGYLNDDLSASDLARVGSGVDAEMIKDERVLRSASTVTVLSQGVLSVATLVTPSLGPTFRLVLAVSQVTASVLLVSQ